MTYTFATMEVSKETFEEIKQKLLAAEYHHAIHIDRFDKTTTLDMHGIGLVLEKKEA